MARVRTDWFPPHTESFRLQRNRNPSVFEIIDGLNNVLKVLFLLK